METAEVFFQHLAVNAILVTLSLTAARLMRSVHFDPMPELSVKGGSLVLVMTVFTVFVPVRFWFIIPNLLALLLCFVSMITLFGLDSRDSYNVTGLFWSFSIIASVLMSVTAWSKNHTCYV